MPLIERVPAEDGGEDVCTAVCETQLQHALARSDDVDTRLLLGQEWAASAHKSVLCARSRVFTKMFEHETLEKHTKTLKLEEISAEGLRLLLEFLYLGTKSWLKKHVVSASVVMRAFMPCSTCVIGSCLTHIHNTNVHTHTAQTCIDALTERL